MLGSIGCIQLLELGVVARHLILVLSELEATWKPAKAEAYSYL